MVDLSDLTPEQKQQLAQQLAAEEKVKEEKRKSEKQTYAHLRDVTVEKVFAKLQAVSIQLEKSKQEYYDEFNALLELKGSLFNLKDGQKSHDWSNADGTVTITTGFNSIDFWDDTKSVGLVKVNNWLDGMVTEENKSFVKIIRELLKPNQKGDLKASRVIDLVNVADEIGDPALIEAVKILMESHKSVKSGTYIKASYTDENGEKRSLPLSFSSIK